MINKDLVSNESHEVSFEESQKYSKRSIKKYLLKEKTNSKLKAFTSLLEECI